MRIYIYIYIQYIPNQKNSATLDIYMSFVSLLFFLREQRIYIYLKVAELFWLGICKCTMYTCMYAYVCVPCVCMCTMCMYMYHVYVCVPCVCMCTMCMYVYHVYMHVLCSCYTITFQLCALQRWSSNSSSTCLFLQFICLIKTNSACKTNM